MKNIITIAAVIVLFAFVIESCKKDSSSNVVAAKRQLCYVTKQSKGADMLYEFIYDTTSTLLRINEYSKGALSNYSVYEYNSLRRKSVVRSYDGNNNATHYTTFDYLPTGYIKSASKYEKIKNGDFVKTYRNDYQYTNSGQVIKESFYSIDTLNQTGSSAKLYKIIAYSYDVKGNAVSVTVSEVKETTNYYGGSNVSETIYQIETLDYDGKYNLFKELPSVLSSDLPLYTELNSISASNATKVIFNNLRGDILAQSYTTTYEYNEQGYPTKQTVIPIGGGSQTVYTFDYKCKEQK